MTSKTILSESHKANIAKAKTGQKHSEETRQKIKASWIKRKARMAKTKTPLTQIEK